MVKRGGIWNDSHFFRKSFDDSIFFHSRGWPQAKPEKAAEKATKKPAEKATKKPTDKATEKATEKAAEKEQPAPKAGDFMRDGDCCLESVSTNTIVRSAFFNPPNQKIFGELGLKIWDFLPGISIATGQSRSIRSPQWLQLLEATGSASSAAEPMKEPDSEPEAEEMLGHKLMDCF